MKIICGYCEQYVDDKSGYCPNCGARIQAPKPSRNANDWESYDLEEDFDIPTKRSSGMYGMNMGYAKKVPFYRKAWFMWVMLIFFPPAGIALMFAYNKKFSTTTKIILSVVFALYSLAIIISNSIESKTTYTIDGKPYEVKGSYATMEKHIGISDVEKLVEMGVREFTSVPSSFNDKKLRITVDGETNLVLTYVDGTLEKIYNGSKKEEIYYSTDEYDDLYDYKTRKIVVDNSEKREIKRQEELAARTKTLPTGTYEVGVDLEPGTYDCIAASGNGNLFIYSSSGSLKVNEVFGVGDGYFDDLYTKTYNNVTLSKGYTIEISGGLAVTFQAK